MTEVARGAVDKVLEKVVSRKLLVWATATALMFNATDIGRAPAGALQISSSFCQRMIMAHSRNLWKS